jgi:ankyrin repeat protein
MTTPLTVAIETRNTALVRHLLNIGANVEDEFALRAAVTAGHEMVLTLLTARSLKLWCRKPKFALPALQLAIIKKDVPSIRSLLEHGAPVHEMFEQSPFPEANAALPSDEFRKHQTAMETAIIEDRNEELPIFRLVLSAWESLNSPWIGPAWQRTRPLSLAVKYGNYHAINLLIVRGADLNATVHGNCIGSPLEIASERGDINLVRKFLSLGADVNATPTNRFHLPALQYAAKNGFYAIAQLLLSKGAYVDAPGPRPYSWTSLELAAQHGRLDMIQLLVDRGAQLYGMGTTQFERAKKLATENKSSAVAELLDLLLEKQLASLNHNFQGQWVVSEGDEVVVDELQQREPRLVPVQSQSSNWSSIDNLDFDSNVLPEGDIEFWSGVPNY